MTGLVGARVGVRVGVTVAVGVRVTVIAQFDLPGVPFIALLFRSCATTTVLA